MKTRRILRRHAKSRALTRFGLKLTSTDLDQLRADIANGRAELIERQSHNRSLWKVSIKDQVYTVAYDRKRKTVVTFLPKTSETKGENNNEPLCSSGDRA